MNTEYKKTPETPRIMKDAIDKVMDAETRDRAETDCEQSMLNDVDMCNNETIESLRDLLDGIKDDHDKLHAHLISKGYGHNAIKRILAGEVVR